MSHDPSTPSRAAFGNPLLPVRHPGSRPSRPAAAGGGARYDRRAMLGLGAAGAAALALGTAGRSSLAGQTAGGPRPITLAWNATAICTASAPVAQEEGIFADYGLAVEFVNFGGSTEALLEAIATGKADAGVGMALRWLKPLEQGFDVKITAGIHGGCMRLLAAADSGITSLADLKGKRIAISDLASPGKNFFAIRFAKEGVDPVSDVEFLQYPGDALPLAIQKGEVDALIDGDPKTWLWLGDPDLGLVEIASNLDGEYAHRTCCIAGVSGSLVREEREIAGALTQALLDAGNIVYDQPEVAAAAFQKYGGQGTVEELAEMILAQQHHHQHIDAELQDQIALYADELKLVQVFNQNTDSGVFAETVFADVLS